MILTIFLAISLASVIIAYWVLCRRNAFKYQTNAAKLIATYFKDDQVSEKDKDAIYSGYLLMRKCYSLPLAAVLTPVMLIWMLIKNGKLDVSATPRTKQKLYNQIFDQLLKMAITKNPITAVLSIAFIGVSFALIVPLGIVFNRVNSMPTLEGMATLYSKVTSKVAKRAHMH